MFTDAQRIDWMQAHPCNIKWHYQRGWVVAWGFPFGEAEGPTLRDALDSAMRQAPMEGAYLMSPGDDLPRSPGPAEGDPPHVRRMAEAIANHGGVCWVAGEPGGHGRPPIVAYLRSVWASGKAWLSKRPESAPVREFIVAAQEPGDRGGAAVCLRIARQLASLGFTRATDHRPEDREG